MPLVTNKCCCVPPSTCLCRDEGEDAILLPDELTATITDDNGNCPCWNDVVVPMLFEVGPCFPSLLCWFACFDLPLCREIQGAFILLQCPVNESCTEFSMDIGQQSDAGGDSCLPGPPGLGTCLNNFRQNPDTGCSCDPLFLRYSGLVMDGSDCCDDVSDTLIRRLTVTITE